MNRPLAATTNFISLSWACSWFVALTMKVCLRIRPSPEPCSRYQTVESTGVRARGARGFLYHPLIDAGDVAALKAKILASGLTVAQLVGAAWASASTLKDDRIQWSRDRGTGSYQSIHSLSRPTKFPASGPLNPSTWGRAESKTVIRSEFP
jgi:hypothetical protein